MIDRVKLGDTLDISRIVLGKWRLADVEDTSPATIQARIETALAQGITTLDQADIYGGYMAEELMGNALRAAPHLRDQIEIVTKCDIVAPVGRYEDAPVKYYDTSREHIEASVDSSLRLMGIEQIDLLLIHRPDPMMNPAETGQTLDDLVRAGKVRAVGVSNFRPWDVTLLQTQMTSALVTNQIELSLAHLDPLTNGDLSFLQERGVRPMAWSPLGGGGLFENHVLRATLEAMGREYGVDPAAVAVAWLLAHPAGVIPVMGSNRVDRIAKFSQAAQVEMSRENWFVLYTAALGCEVA